MKVILFEDKANAGTLKRDTTNRTAKDRMPREQRLKIELNELRRLANCNIYLATIRGNRLVHARKIANRNF